jgi:hypothetical protein
MGHLHLDPEDTNLALGVDRMDLQIRPAAVFPGLGVDRVELEELFLEQNATTPVDRVDDRRNPDLPGLLQDPLGPDVGVGGRSAAGAWGSAPGALRIGFRPASGVTTGKIGQRVSNALQPGPREAAPPFAPPVSPTGKGSGAPCACTPVPRRQT